MSNITDEAYERLQKMLANSQNTKVVVANLVLSKEEKIALYNKLTRDMEKHGKTNPYIAGLVADHLLDFIDTFLVNRMKTAEQNASKGNDPDSMSPIFRRVDG